VYDQLNATLASSNQMIQHLQNPKGTFGQLLNDPTLYNNLNRMLGTADTLVATLGAGVNSGNGTVGKLLRDDELYNRLVSAVAGVDTVVATMQHGNGTVNKLFTDAQLYDQMLKAVTSLNTVLTDVRRDPRRYTKGLITVF
jgi:phospholipid/cholesterol/gamma-HCH transport system substrate-binding protein